MRKTGETHQALLLSIFFFPLSDGVKAQGGLLNSIMKFRIIGVLNTNSGAVACADGVYDREENTAPEARNAVFLRKPYLWHTVRHLKVKRVLQSP